MIELTIKPKSKRGVANGKKSFKSIESCLYGD